MKNEDFDKTIFYDIEEYQITNLTQVKIKSSSLKLDAGDHQMKDYYVLDILFKNEILIAEKTFKDFEELNGYVIRTFEAMRNSLDPVYRDEANRIL